MRPITTLLSATLLSAVAAVALVGALASPAAANPNPLPLPEVGTLVGEGLSVEGPLVQNVSLMK